MFTIVRQLEEEGGYRENKGSTGKETCREKSCHICERQAKEACTDNLYGGDVRGN